jgi:hypothetical protein
VLRWSPGPRIRRRVELTGSCSAAAAGTRAPASTWFARDNKSVSRLYWHVENGSGTQVARVTRGHWSSSTEHQWWRRRLGNSREEGACGFCRRAQGGGGASLRAKATKLRCGPQHGRSMAEGGGDVRRPSTNGARRFPPSGRWGSAAWPGSGPPTSWTSIKERDAWSIGRGLASACVYGVVRRQAGRPCATSRAHAVPMRSSAPQFKVALFD